MVGTTTTPPHRRMDRGWRWESTGDDICHVSSLVMSAAEREDHANGSTTLWLRCSAGDTYCRHNARGANEQVMVGDVLQFFNRSSGELVAERTVAAAPSRRCRRVVRGGLARRARPCKVAMRSRGSTSVSLGAPLHRLRPRRTCST